MSYYCVDPCLRAWKNISASMSILGRWGSSIFFDRFIEYMNDRQKQRNQSYQSFDSALHYTQHLQAMMHADAAFTAALLGSSPGADDGFDQRILNDALALAQKFQSELGSDLTRVNPGNPWWHTGNPLNLSAGVSRLRRPWEYIWAVARGASTGAGYSHPEHVVAFAQRYMEDYLFKK